MQSDTASDLAAVLKAILSPTHHGWRRAAMATRLFGYDSAMLATLTTADADAWLANFMTWNDLWHRQGIAAVMARLEADSRATLRLARAPAGARHLTDLRHLVELLQAVKPRASMRPSSSCSGSRASGCRTAAQRMNACIGWKKTATPSRSSRYTGSRGWNSTLCFAPTCGQCGRMPVSPTVCSSAATTAGYSPTAHQRDNRTEHRAYSAERLREDVLRLAYVALTRARRRVTLLAGPLGYTRKSPLPPTSLDWLLRTDDQVDSLEDWYRDVTDRKKEVATCEHGDTLRRFPRGVPTRDDRVCPALAHRDGLDRPWT